MNFTEVKSILDSVTELVKKSTTLPLQEKIVDLRDYIISLREENITLKEENQVLKLEISTEQDFILKEGMYWIEGDEIPFCQKCLDGSKKRIRLQFWGDGRKCFECKSFYEPRGQAGRVKVFTSNFSGRNSNR